MPKAYESMRDKFAKGAPKDSPEYNEAQSKAARIYNAKHKDEPVRPDKYERMKKGKKKSKKKKAKAVGRSSFASEIFGKD